jgi:hypothetical protein
MLWVAGDPCADRDASEGGAEGRRLTQQAFGENETMDPVGWPTCRCLLILHPPHGVLPFSATNAPSTSCASSKDGARLEGESGSAY